MLLEIAIGDAYGMGFEFAKKDALKERKNDGETYAPHPFHDIKPGHYTDDTQMSLAVAEVLLAQGPLARREHFAEAFVKAYHRDPRLGYSSGFQALLNETKTGAELCQKLRPQSIGSGSAMRACPIGFLEKQDDVLRVAETQARITHDTLEGIAAAQGVAMMIHWSLQHGPDVRFQLRNKIRSLHPLLDEALWKPWTDPVPNEGLPALNAALSVLESADNMQDAAIRSVSTAGDVDTVAAIAMGAASLLLPNEKRHIPENLMNNLENKAYGRSYLEKLDKQLFQTFLPKPRSL